MHCLNRNHHLAFFFRNLLFQEKICRHSISPWLSNLSCNKNCFSSKSIQTHNFSMSEEASEDHKSRSCEAVKDENMKLKDDEFFVLDSSPSPILIDIDHPNKFRKSTRKILGCKSVLVKQHSKHLKSDDSVPSSSGNKKSHGTDSSVGHLSQLIGKTGNKEHTNGALSKKVYSKSKASTTTEEEEGIFYEGTFTRNYLPVKVENPGFFRAHLHKSTTPTRAQKRCFSSSKTHYHRDAVTNKSKAYFKSKNLCSLIQTDLNNSLQRKPSEIGFEGTLGSINYLNRVPSTSDSDSDVIIEDEIRREKVPTRPHVKNKATSSPTTVDESPSFSTLPKKSLESCEILNSESLEQRLTDNKTADDIELNVISLVGAVRKEEEIEVREASDSNDSLFNYLVQRSDSDDVSVDMRIDDDDSSESDINITVDNSDFIPLTNIQLRDVEYDVPITEDVRIKRQKLEALRKWELTGLGVELVCSSKNIDGMLFTLLSYNVLAQQLIQDNMYLYSNCDPKILDWSYRWALLQHEVRHLQPDIMTFQEVESSHYHTHYLPWLTHRGYKCIFKKRTGSKCDGCIIAYDIRKFTLIEEMSVEFYQPEGGSILDRDNVGIIAKLTPTTFNSPFCVATTHILFNPKRSDVKLAQLVLLLTELDRICYEREEGGKPVYCPIILTGDFNSEPHSRLLDVIRKGTLRYSGLSKRNLSRYGYGPNFEMKLMPSILGISDYCQHNALQQGRYLEKIRGNLFSLKDKRKIEEKLIKIFHSDRNSASSSLKASPSVCSEARLPASSSSLGVISHSFNFKSTYYHKLGRANDAPEVTTFQDHWVTVDYIFYTRVQSNHNLVEGDLKLIGRYGLLSPAEAMRVGPLPSDVCPSDHLPLAAQFLLRQKKE